MSAEIKKQFKTFTLITVTIVLAGCGMSPDELKLRMLGSWSGEDGEYRGCITLNEDGSMRALREVGLSGEKKSLVLLEGGWITYRGKRFGVAMEEVTDIRGNTIPKTKRSVANEWYAIASITEQRIDYRAIGENGIEDKSLTYKRVEHCKDYFLDYPASPLFQP